jgi:hypothetical protein
LEDQLNTYRQQWQADQKKQIIAKMAGKMPGNTNEGKIKNSERNHHNSSGGCISTRQSNTSRRGRGRGRGGHGGRGNKKCKRPKRQHWSGTRPSQIHEGQVPSQAHIHLKYDRLQVFVCSNSDVHIFVQEDFYQAEPDVVADIMIQLSVKAGLKQWGDKAFMATHYEIKQLHL